MTFGICGTATRNTRKVSGPVCERCQVGKFSQPGHWPDADMLPIGHLAPAPGWGKPRDPRLTHDEQRTLVTLWTIFRSPLMVGGKLPATDEWTLSLLTNPEVIAVDQQSTNSHPVISTNSTAIWTSEPTSGGGYYVAAFNLSPEASKIHYAWSELGFGSGGYKLRDLWTRKDLATAKGLDLSLPSHGCLLYRLVPQ
jgi:alpha-galactosidase